MGNNRPFGVHSLLGVVGVGDGSASRFSRNFISDADGFVPIGLGSSFEAKARISRRIEQGPHLSPELASRSSSREILDCRIRGSVVSNGQDLVVFLFAEISQLRYKIVDKLPASLRRADVALLPVYK